MSILKYILGFVNSFLRRKSEDSPPTRPKTGFLGQFWLENEQNSKLPRFLITSRHTMKSDSAINPAKDD